MFLQKKPSASSFLQKQMNCLIICTEENEGPHYFFRKNWSAALFLQNKPLIFFCEEIMRCLIYSEEIMRRHIFISRNNDMLGRVTSIILWVWLLQWKNKAPQNFFKKNEAPEYFFRQKHWFFCEEIMRRLIFSEEIMRCLIFFWRNNEVLELGTSIILLMLFPH